LRVVRNTVLMIAVFVVVRALREGLATGPVPIFGSVMLRPESRLLVIIPVADR
jgi:hypothetical protein